MLQQGKQQQIQLHVVIYGYQHELSKNIYVGSANNHERRKRTHLNSLLVDDHHCVALQELWNDVQGQGFTWLILEELYNISKKERKL